MRPDKKNQNFEENAGGGKWRLWLTLGAIGLAGWAGYKVGQSSAEKAASQGQDDLAAGEERLIAAENESRQCRQIIRRLVASNQVKKSQIAEMEEQFKQPDEAQCKAVIAVSAREKAKKLADSLCISNPDDIENISVEMARNYTELMTVSLHNKMLKLKDTGDEGMDWNRTQIIHLEEAPECVPEKYIEFDQNDDEESKEMKKMLSEGEYEEIIDQFDAEASCAGVKADSMDADECYLVTDVQERLKGVTDIDEKRDKVCDAVVAQIAWGMEQADEGVKGQWYAADFSPEAQRQGMRREVYLEALFRSVGLSQDGFGDEEALFRCLVPHYKNPAMCEPAGEELTVEMSMEEEDENEDENENEGS
jgi:hypothetical protein